MNGLRAIIGSIGPEIRRFADRALLAVTAIVAVAIPALVLLSLAQEAASRSKETWRAHHEACHQIPEEVYHRDRFRAIRGRVTDGDGRPITGARVRCVKLESLVELAKAGPPAPARWSVPIEAESRTDDSGRYEFPHLAVGGRTLFYSPPPGRDLAPAIKDLVVVQDGLGAQLDVTLAQPAKLLVRFRTPVREATRLYLVPQRWWPSPASATVPATWRATEFRRLGGPFRKGLIAMAGPDESAPLRIIGRYDLDRSAEVELSGRETPVTRHDLPEAAGIEPWRFEPSTEERLFYAAMSPVPLFWRESATGWPSWLPLPAFLERLGAADGVSSNEEGSRLVAPVGAGPVRQSGPDPVGGRSPLRQQTGSERSVVGAGPGRRPGGSGPDPVGAGSDRRSVRSDGVGGRSPLRQQIGRIGSRAEPPPTRGLLADPADGRSSRRGSHATGVVRGFAPHPFLPVLVEAHTAGPRLAWTSDASEFEVDGLPPGSYRVRALDLFGRVTFAAGVSVRPDRTAGPDEHVRLWSQVDLEEPDSRQVMGFVKWESGLPVAKAVVFMQCSYNFRRYVRRVETDEQGFFRFADVPGNEPYFIFALPPGDENAMRSLESFGVGAVQREVWRELTLHPHRVTGTINELPQVQVGAAPSSPRPTGERVPEGRVRGTPPAPAEARVPEGRVSGDSTSLQLVRIGGQSEPVVWTFRAEPSGRFTVSNVPHGRYCVPMTQGDGKPSVRSLPFDVGDGKPETAVRWLP